jgi:hypothetical protein
LFKKVRDGEGAIASTRGRVRSPSLYSFHLDTLVRFLRDLPP